MSECTFCGIDDHCTIAAECLCKDLFLHIDCIIEYNDSIEANNSDPTQCYVCNTQYSGTLLNQIITIDTILSGTKITKRAALKLLTLIKYENNIQKMCDNDKICSIIAQLFPEITKKTEITIADIFATIAKIFALNQRISRKSQYKIRLFMVIYKYIQTQKEKEDFSWQKDYDNLILQFIADKQFIGSEHFLDKSYLAPSVKEQAEKEKQENNNDQETMASIDIIRRIETTYRKYHQRMLMTDLTILFPDFENITITINENTKKIAINFEAAIIDDPDAEYGEIQDVKKFLMENYKPIIKQCSEPNM